MKLSEIFKDSSDVEIRGLAEDSRDVKEGYLFFATKGYNVDHFDYIDMAIKNGAVAIVCDRNPNKDIETIIVDDVKETLINICQKYYDVSPSDFDFIGITGTDGKTSTASIIKQLLECAYIGTNGLEVADINESISNTTPSICELYKCLGTIKNKGIKTVSMEVSSESLLHGRVDSLSYLIAGYTNIEEDHLNIHKTIDNYVGAKKKLMNLVKEEGCIFVNGDDDILKDFVHNNLFTYGFNTDNDYVICDVVYEKKYVTFSIKGNDKEYKIKSPLKERFNIYNVSLAFLICLRFGIDKDILIDRIKGLKVIKGRVEHLDFGQDFEIVLDYAHTLNAIKELVTSFKGKNIIVVTGAAGGREKEKRAKIGEYLLNNVNKVIFTMDDPRWESVDDIINQMIGDYTFKDNYLRINDRVAAIYKAFELAKKDDVVLIIGKGRDNYMAIGDDKVKYCDYDVICKCF